MNSESTAPADHLQRSAAQRNKLRAVEPSSNGRPAPWSREARAVDCGPPVSTRRTGAPKSGRPRR
eukprot:6484450-Prymnesium_polylepis.1